MCLFARISETPNSLVPSLIQITSVAKFRSYWNFSLLLKAKWLLRKKTETYYRWLVKLKTSKSCLIFLSFPGIFWKFPGHLFSLISMSRCFYNKGILKILSNIYEGVLCKKLLACFRSKLFSQKSCFMDV